MYAEFYEGREIFITGGSGVVGKATIEKLLRSCNVKRIFILMRCKGNTTAEERLEDIKNSKIFNVLKEQKPNEFDKLSVIPGDVSLDGLGISPEDLKKLQNVSIFFHSAATTRFNEPLLKAIRCNLKSTLECLKLAETLSNLSMFTYVSTFYSNPYLTYIENKMYPPVFDWRVALQLLEMESGPLLDTLTDKLIGGFPNTYLFTKHLAEHLVNEYRSKLPVCIFRPSIVVNAFEEPEPGFTESSTGVMGIILVLGTGLIQILMARGDRKLDISPLDYTAKILLISTTRAAILPREKIEERIPITILSSCGLLLLKLKTQMRLLTAGVAENPFLKSVWLPSLWLTPCPFVYYLGTYLLQLLPSLLLDGMLKLAGQRPFFMAIQRKIVVTVQVLKFFLTNEYFSDGITDYDELEQSARGTEFSISLASKKARTYEELKETTAIMIDGCRRYLLNEDDSYLPLARRVLRIKKILYNILRGYVLYLILKKIYYIAMDYVGYYMEWQ